MMTFVGVNLIFNQAPTIWMDIGFTFIFYGVYYGVVGRDLSEICADKMAASIGVSTDSSKTFKMERIKFCTHFFHISNYSIIPQLECQYVVWNKMCALYAAMIY